MNIEIFDTECFPNFFCYTGMNRDTLEIKRFYIYDDYNQLTDFVKYIRTLDGMIGFNNINYDYPVLHYILNNYEDWSIFELPTILYMIYEESNRVIKTEFSSVAYWKIKIPQLDLFKIWHFDNKGRMTSLKSLEISMNFDNVQDIPFEENHYVQPDEIENILSYNLNDVRATYEFYKLTIKEGKIDLRKDISKHYGFNCLNFSDVKIGDSINKTVYSKLSGKSYNEFKDKRTYRPRIRLSDCIPSYIEFQSETLQNFLNSLKTKTIISTKDGLKFDIIYNKTKYTIAQGGLHSNDKPRWLKSDENYQLIDADVRSYYPATILNLGIYPAHLGREWLEGYRETFNNRLNAKKEGKKYIAEALKLSLNGKRQLPF